jgi:MOSC domain-containing protein YiiM
MGIIESIYSASIESAPTESKQSVRVVKNGGIVGDRQTTNITLIEASAVESAQLNPGESRRQLTVRGLEQDINLLVGQQFRVGTVLCEGVELCHPCAYLEKLTERPGLTKLLANRGGIRARVLEDGEITVGDTITLLNSYTLLNS